MAQIVPEILSREQKCFKWGIKITPKFDNLIHFSRNVHRKKRLFQIWDLTVSAFEKAVIFLANFWRSESNFFNNCDDRKLKFLAMSTLSKHSCSIFIFPWQIIIKPWDIFHAKIFIRKPKSICLVPLSFSLSHPQKILPVFYSPRRRKKV